MVDLVAERVSLKRAGRNLKGLCPFHQEKTPSFNVLPDRQIFKCFGCNVGGDVFKFVQLTENVEFAEAVRILADRIGLELKPRRSDPSGAPVIGRADIARANEWAVRWFRQQLLSPAGEQVRTYVENRRIAPDVAERFELGYAPGGELLLKAARQAGLGAPLLTAADLIRSNEQGGVYETFRQRLIFPIRDGSNRCIGFGGRALGDSPAKYLNTARTELFDKSRCLFGLPLAREEVRRRGFVVVVEGYTDCIACHQHGFANTVATLGTAATEEHMRALRRYVDTAVLLFDSDAAGQAAAERALAVALQQNLTVKIAQVPEGKDPADYLQTAGAEEFGELLNSAADALGFMWNLTLTRFQDTVEGDEAHHRQAVVEFVNLVRELGQFGAVDAIQRGVIIHQVARLLALSADEVAGLFAPQPKRRAPANQAVQQADASTGQPAGGPEQLVLVGMLEILVCEPGLLGEVEEVFKPEWFQDPVYRQMAEVFLQMADRYGEFDASELIAALESPVQAGLITDMIVRGTERGNFSATLADLKDRWTDWDAMRLSRVAGAKVKQLPNSETTELSDDEVDAHLAAVQQGCLQRHHFASVQNPASGQNRLG
ncbi:MAG: DNA primase [Phycisphaerae bacterium]|nr:DNA primase [Phycisphaerae bacterium]